MGIDLATWRLRIGLNYHHMCCPLQNRWRSRCGWLFQPEMASWGVGEIMNDTPLVLKGCMMTLSLMMQYVHFWPNLNGRGGGGKVHCHWRATTSQVREAVDGGWKLLLRAIVVVIPLLLVIAGDVETNPGPPKREGVTLKAAINALHSVCPKWYDIGIQLDVPTFQLRNFERKTRDSMDQLRDTLDYWMNNDPSPSWRGLVDALKSPSVGAKRLAEKIEEECCDPEEQSSYKGPATAVHVAKCHQVQSPTAVLSRQGQSGHYRGQLNFMYQNEVITKPDIEEIEHRNESGGVAGYTGIVRFEIVATGEKKVFSGSGPSKSAAYEDAAQTAVNKIQHLTVARSDVPVVPHKQASACSSMKPSSISPKVMPPALSMSPLKTAVTTLKEYCEKKGLPQPQYSEIPLRKEQQFQFKVSLRSVEVTGKVCSSKQQAKQSAAQLAIRKLGQ